MFGNSFSVRAVLNCWQYTPRRYKCTLQDAVMALEIIRGAKETLPFALLGHVSLCIAVAAGLITPPQGRILLRRLGNYSAALPPPIPLSPSSPVDSSKIIGASARHRGVTE